MRKVLALCCVGNTLAKLFHPDVGYANGTETMHMEQNFVRTIVPLLDKLRCLDEKSSDLFLLELPPFASNSWKAIMRI